MAGVGAALWLLGLFAAAPALRTAQRYDFTDRLRDALILGVAIPFALGFVHALYAAACWIALAACIASAYARGFFPERESRPARAPYVLVVALAAVAWPQLIRPLLEGDSLSYHLPNAAAWVQSHSVWTTATRYWWYPPASELFASGLYATSGPFALAWSGFGALTLLGFRIYAWTRESGASPLLGDTLAAATVAAYPLAIQAGTLQNDVWLAAFWIESLWRLRGSGDAGAAQRTVAVSALIKPQGWILTAIALLARRAGVRPWAAAGVAFGLWVLHDALLWRGSIVAPSTTLYAGDFGSTILGHGFPAIALLLRVAAVVAPFALVAILAAAGGPWLARRDRALGWAACAAALLVLVIPFGYATAVAQLATGASLRFAAPAIAAGAAILSSASQRFTRLATVFFAACTAVGIWQIGATFWNDAPTRTALGVAALAVLSIWCARRPLGRWTAIAGFAAAVVASQALAQRHTVDFFTDAFRVHGRASGIYAWLASNRPPAVGGWGLALGTVNVLAPGARTVELPESDACAAARQQRVMLVAVAQDDRSAAFNAARLKAARSCGPVSFDDGLAVAARPQVAR